MKKKILLGLLAILVIIQFIRPERNISTGNSTNYIGKKYTVPANIQTILDKACLDCHSNNTGYPWYTNIQPVGFWLQNHVNEGKGEINFDEFLSYSPKKAHNKLEECKEMIDKGEMPLNSYTWMHNDAKLTAEEKQILTEWTTGIMTQIASENKVDTKKQHHP